MNVENAFDPLKSLAKFAIADYEETKNKVSQPGVEEFKVFNRPGNFSDPDWTVPLYSPTGNSLNPSFVNAVLLGLTGILAAFALIQLIQLVSLKSRQTTNKYTPTSQVFKIFLVVVQAFLYGSLYFLEENLANSSLLSGAALWSALLLPIQFYEPKVSGNASASVLISVTLTTVIFVAAVVQDYFSSIKVFAASKTGAVLELLIVVDSVIVLILETSYYQPVFEIDEEIDGIPVNIFSVVTYTWITPLINHIYANQRAELEDLPNVGKELFCENTFDKLEANWEKSTRDASVAKKKFKPSRFNIWAKKSEDIKPSLLLSIVYSFKGYVIASFIFEFFDIFFSFVQPFLLRSLIKHFNESLSLEIPPPIIEGYTIALTMFLLSLSKTMFVNQMYLNMFKLGYVVESSLTTLIYKKALKLSPHARKDKPTGEIINHTTVDLSMIKMFCQSFQDFFGAPIRLIICLFSLFGLLGNATWGGLLIGALLIPVAVYANTTIYPVYMGMMKHKDERTGLINEILVSIKSIKLYSWEKPLMKKLNAIRNDKELASAKKMGVLNAVLQFLWSCIPFFVSAATYSTFVFIYKTPLTPDIVFPALVYFDLLSDTVLSIPSLVSSSIESFASVSRLRDYLLLDELDFDMNGAYVKTDASDAENSIEIQNSTFVWSKHEQKPEYKDEEDEVENNAKDSNIALSDISFKAKKGELTCIVGKVGSGKTTLLRSILGEIPLLTAEYSDDVVNSEQAKITVNGTIAYCPQSPWILNATVKENILFGFKYDRDFYHKTIDACELVSDFKSLPDGDQTVVGEKGIALSGGQKARIALARAVYARADIYLFDDILSAVDSHVGKNLIKKVLADDGIIGPRTKILATNSVRVLHQANQIFLLTKGSITESGTYDEVNERKSDLANLIEEFSRGKDDEEEEEEEQDTPIVEANANDLNDEIQQFHGEDAAPKVENTLRRASVVSYNHNYENEETETDGAGRKTGQLEEFKASGGLKWSTIVEYCKACNYKYVFVYIVMTFGVTLLGVAEKYILTYWTQWNSDTGETQRPAFFLSFYILCGITSGAMILFSSFVVWTFCIVKGSAYFHERMANSVLRAPMSYFETTPIGRILNRFTDDISTIDMSLPWMLIMLVSSVLLGIMAIGIIIINLPIMFFLIIGLVVVYNYYRSQFIPSSRELKRLLKVSKSPLLATIQESINGVDTIKAFDQKGRFTHKTKSLVDRNILIQYVSQLCNRWLSIRLQFISSSILFFASTLATSSLLTSNPIQPGLLGFIMSFALGISNILTMIVRIWSEVESQSVALERILEYCALTPEAPMIVENNRPNENWPTEGVVTFKNYATKYRENLDPVLKGINATIKAKEKVGIVGRTGAGKSSLTLALFRIIEATEGYIEIDGVNTSKIGLYDLRYHLNIIPQESHTIKGSVRDNLDPFQQYSDERIWKVLELAHLKEHVSQMSTKPTEQELKESSNPDDESPKTGLQARLDESGSNLSSGQRQLMSLARALLNDNAKVLILDEATSSVDVETDKVIQDTIRSEFKDKTILTIAHRLETILDSDRVLVLDKGEIREFDAPDTLLKDKNSIFYSLCKEGGYLKSN
ncbi:uncharacterized protein CANTADRAFT_4932 [Suhomyces tanzawaensis NRRL Y-17324]|uniref:P-loop containing nucleoside triphosphate hydrolase protein n=1 Tax=Suhomyces tanzawaensis NRRL Y-17324 TaxID=984487 RepID=A0A1E4SN39_9ASCO|nr:uncharacterized protein CANTADRAFT_4932 [Suhomyces tanzawaensis NRRL Y-17324]ODV80944.1 hypothetical protein CANTADRAFT_4932 [Suhomyces tanzawaensis NRRL Y-17324]